LSTNAGQERHDAIVVLRDDRDHVRPAGETVYSGCQYLRVR
jgi:hypothetical protein